MFNPSRHQVREFFFQAWGRFKAGQPLSDLEKVAVEHMVRHPEYHPVLDQPDRYRDREWPPELGETNPFLHLSLHLSIAEQVSIDRPTGVKAHYERLVTRLGDEHAAQHAVMDCLGEMIWRAQRDRQPLDGEAFIKCLETKCPG
jgi:hypothetical protein